MGVLSKVKALPHALVKWLHSSPDATPVDVREFNESQRRLYEQSHALQGATDEFTRMVKNMTRSRRGRRKGAQ